MAKLARNTKNVEVIIIGMRFFSSFPKFNPGRQAVYLCFAINRRCSLEISLVRSGRVWYSGMFSALTNEEISHYSWFSTSGLGYSIGANIRF